MRSIFLLDSYCSLKKRVLSVKLMFGYYVIMNNTLTADKSDKTTDKTREKILQLLKINGEMTVAALSEELEVSSVNIRGHLSRMDRDGLVSMRCEKGHDRGRPSHLYQLTEKGHA